MPHSEWILYAVMAGLGLIVHWMKQFIMARSSNTPNMKPLSAKEYWVGHWPETIIAVASAVGGVAFLHELGYLNMAAAFGMGYVGNSIADVIGGRVQAMIDAAK